MAKKNAKKGENDFIRKLTAKNIMEKPIKSIAAEYEEGSVVELFKVAGIINRVRAVSTQYGDSVGFKGQFRVIRSTDGVIFDGREFFAPGDLHDDLLTAWQSRAEDQSAVEFAAVVSIEIDGESNTGYVFMSDPLISAQSPKALDDLCAKAFKALPKPPKE